MSGAMSFFLTLFPLSSREHKMGKKEKKKKVKNRLEGMLTSSSWRREKL